MRRSVTRLEGGAIEIRWASDRIPGVDADQIEAGGAERLAFEPQITDFASLVEKDSALQLMGSLALVEAGLIAPRNAGPEYRSIMKSDRSIRPALSRCFASAKNEMCTCQSGTGGCHDFPLHHSPDTVNVGGRS